jgi:hypothetical protein
VKGEDEGKSFHNENFSCAAKMHMSNYCNQRARLRWKVGGNFQKFCNGEVFENSMPVAIV